LHYSQVHYVILPDFCGEYQNYTLLETSLYKQSEKNNVSICPDTYMAASLDLTKWLS